MKRRIMTKSQILKAIYDRSEEKPSDHRINFEQLNCDIVAHMLADGGEVRVYNDVAMGGMVVEYNE